jgi:glycosyltransferase involved in cell wall biosynthesis
MGEPLNREAPISVVVPAHDEVAVIGRLLEALSDRRRDDEIVVVCDGCTDATAEVARLWPGVHVIEQERLGKPAALNTGDRAATLFPRFYVDADVVVTMGTLRHVARAMSGPVLAGAPRLEVDTRRASRAVRAYYDIWTRLPYASEAVLGSGVIGLTAEGRARFGEFPDLIADDDFVRRRFAVPERATAGRFTVTTPQRMGPLIAIKTRSRLGILQLDELEGSAPRASGEPGARALLRLLRQPALWPHIAVYVLVRGVTEARARRRLAARRFAWDRDETSRIPVGPVGA